MNIIIVAKFLKCPRKFSARDPRIWGVCAAALLLIGSAGAGLALLLHDPTSQALADLERVRADLAAQQAEVRGVRDSLERELNALALRLGEMQAQSTRIDALGERLTRSARLDDGEFDFSEPPALGGPLSSTLLVDSNESQIRNALDAFSARLSQQSRQLEVLEMLLLDREVETALLPAGLPVRAGYASSRFGMRADPFTAHQDFHSGIDFNGQLGSDVLAVADGVVTFAGRHSGYGNMVDIDHGNGYMTRYAHNSENLVKPGQRVRSGDVVGKMGRTGRATGVHVHFEVWLNDRAVNPAAYLKGITAKG